MYLLKEKIRFSSYRNKLIISYILFSFVPVFIIGTFAYVNSYNIMKEHVKSNIQGTLIQIQDNIGYKQELLQRISDIIYSDQELQQRFSTYYAIEQKPKAVKEIIDRGNLFQAVEEDIRLSIYTANQTIPEVYYTDPLRDNEFLNRNSFNIYHLNRIQNEDWYQNLLSNNYNWNWEVMYNNDKNGVISLIRNQVDFKNLVNIGIIKIDISLARLFSAVDYQKVASNSSLIVMDETDQILYYSIPEERKISEVVGQKGRYLKIDQQIKNTSWKLVAFVPLRDLKENATSLLYLTVMICFVILFVLVLFSIFLSKVLSSNINKIIYGIEMFKNGHFSYRIEQKGDDEFRQIMSVLNNMAETIQKLIHEVYVTGLQRKEIELQLLQAQINPHFLYNTLSSISRLAKLGKIEELHMMIMALAKFCRLTLNEGRMIISIREEIEQIKAYITIQTIKFGDRLNVSYDLDEDVLWYDTIKFILQPFVENVLEHAWYQDTMHIQIKVYKEDGNIFMKIIDDGIGMTDEVLKQILLDSHTRKGYGMFNVDQRIKLQFGDKYGVTVSSILGEGTTVGLMLPYYQENSKISNSKGHTDCK